MMFLSFFKLIWTWRSVSIPIVATAIGIAGGYRLKTCPTCAPAIDIKVVSHKDIATKEADSIVKDIGKKDVTIKKYAPVSANCPNEPLESRLMEEVVVHQDPTQVSMHKAMDIHAVEEVKSSIVVTTIQQVSLPRLSVAWIPRVSPTLGIGTFTAGVRISERWWIKGSAQPVDPDPKKWNYGVGLEITY